MCGIVGVAGDLWSKDEDAMRRLLTYDYFRGQDATGLAAIRNSGKIVVVKRAEDPFYMFGHKKFQNALNANTSKAFIGHNRSATVGDKDDHQNAHPFECGDVVGVHNGTLYPEDKKVLEEVLGELFETDSEAVFAAIDKLGIEETIKMLHEGDTTVKGAWSFVWYDKKDNTLNFLRNQHRPMFVAFNKGYKTMLYASDWMHIDMATLQNGGYEILGDFLSDDDKKEMKYKYHATEEDVWYSYNLDELKKGSEERPIAKTKTLKGKEPPKVTPQSYNNFPTQGGSQNGSGTKQQDSSKKSPGFHTPLTKPQTSTTTSLSSKLVRHMEGTPENPYAGFYDRMGFSYLAANGCCYCQQPIEYGTPGCTIVDNEDFILCPACSGHDIDSNEDMEPPTRIYVSKATMESLI